MAGLTASQVVSHPAYPYIIRTFTPNIKGTAQGIGPWGSKCSIVYEVHGTGPKKIVWVSGLGVIKWFWQRQCKSFGHERASEFSCLLFDLRGMGESDKPWMKYSMKMYAQDVVAVLDHVGWTSERDLHIVGASMGGMITQELAQLIPNRIASLTLVSTGARLINLATWSETITRIFQSLIPPSLDRKIADMKATFISEEYANAPDAREETDEGFPLFDTRGDRYVAEMVYMHQSPEYSHSAWFRQALAVAGWQMTDKDLARIGDLIGRKRIMVMHGTIDKALPPIHYEQLVKGLGGNGDEGVKLVLLEGCGHIPPLERQSEFAELITSFVEEIHAMDREQ